MPVIAWESKPIDERRREAMRLLVDVHGYSRDVAAGIVGNLERESEIIPSRVEGSKAATPLTARAFDGVVRTFTPDEVMGRVSEKSGPKLAGVGLAQWTYRTRRAGLFKHTYGGNVLGADVLFSMDAQIDYLVQELQSDFKALEKLLRKPTTTLEHAADAFVYDFERPGAILWVNPATGKEERRPKDHAEVIAVFEKRRKAARAALKAGVGSPVAAEVGQPASAAATVPSAPISRAEAVAPAPVPGPAAAPASVTRPSLTSRKRLSATEITKATTYNKGQAGVLWDHARLPSPQRDLAVDSPEFARAVAIDQFYAGLKEDGQLGPNTAALYAEAKVTAAVGSKPLVKPELLSAALARARSALTMGITYELGRGGYAPTASSPAQNGKCDCSGFVAWAIGVSRDPKKNGHFWIETTLMVRDATGAQKMFVAIPSPVPGCLVAYPDSGSRQGHTGVVTSVQPMTGIDCSSSANGIKERGFEVFTKRKDSVFMVPKDWLA